MCFCALFSLLNVEGVYNEPSLCLIVILWRLTCPVNVCLSGEDLHSPPPCVIMVSEPMQLSYDYRDATYS